MGNTDRMRTERRGEGRRVAGGGGRAAALFLGAVAGGAVPGAAQSAAHGAHLELGSPDGREREHLGAAVALEGGLLALGVPQEGDWTQAAGAVHLLREERHGWLAEARLTPPDGAPGDGFGLALAIAGERVAVGAPHAGSDAAGAGAVYVFARTAGSWRLEARLAAPEPELNARFGAALDLDGERLLVGAPSAGGGEPPRGAAFVFRRAGGAWTLEAELAPPGAAGARFGASVALDLDRAAVGAPQAGPPGAPVGAVLVHLRQGTVWTLEQTLSYPGAALDPCFGCALALDGARLAIGTCADEAWLQRRTSAGWVVAQALTAGDDPAGVHQRFGEALALDGGALVVGALGADPELAFAGAVYAFRDDGAVFVEDHKFLAPGGSPGAQLGWAVALDGRRALLGAPNQTVAGQLEAGVAYLLEVAFDFEEACFGDGSGHVCPCGNFGAEGRGCANTAHAEGARLTAVEGAPELGGRGFRVAVGGSVPGGFGLLVAGEALLGGGWGTPFGDGLLCVDGSHLVLAGAAASSAGALELHVDAPLREEAGAMRTLQWWFRDPVQMLCGSGWNTSNGLIVRWRP